MEEKYWNRFVTTGKITDYLYYRGIEICKQVMERYEGDTESGPDNSDRDGDRCSAGWRI